MRASEIRDWLQGLVYIEGDNPLDVKVAEHVVRVWELLEEVDRVRAELGHPAYDKLFGPNFGELRTSLKGQIEPRAYAVQKAQGAQRVPATPVVGRQTV